MTPTTHYALRSIEHNGITVCYAVDFRKQQVSIVDYQGKPKSFIFSNREIKYHQGWHDILDAIRHAMDTGFAELKEYMDTHIEKHIEKATDQILNHSDFYGYVRHKKDSKPSNGLLGLYDYNGDK